ncbi:MAG: hypothetical protein IT374_02665 [Polyangiaceae bacterium]|nr:hypothetical protein [Polyangiaceae bacterium]
MSRALALPCLLALAACGSTSADTGIVPYTDLHVDPETFRGDLPCGTAPGSMRSYVAKVWDVTGQEAVDLSGATPVVVSPATQCAQSAAFSLVEPGRFYVATLDAYDVSAPCLDASTCGAVTAPIASTDCGFGPGPDTPAPPPVEGQLFGPPDATQALYLRRVLLRGCRPMVGAASTRVSSRDLVAGVGCGLDAAHVERLRFVRAGVAPYDVLCGDSISLASVGAVGDRAAVYGYARGEQSPRWGASCEVGAGGLSCGPLSERGAVVVRGADVCDAATGTFTARDVSGGAEVEASCGSEAAFNDLSVASYTILVGGDGRGTCRAVVAPGQRVVASCAR